MQLLVLAGGFGSRLRSVVSDVPKPLAPINGIPFLSFQLDNWASQGIKEFIFLLHFEANVIIEFLKKWNNLEANQDIEIRFVIEHIPLGTGGSVANAVQKLNLTSNFLVTNADTWLGSGIQELSHASAPVISVVEVANAKRYGTIVFDKNLCVTRFTEKIESGNSGWINAGLSLLHPQIFTSWDGKENSLEADYFPSLVKKNCLIALPLKDNFIDIGIPEDYHRFCKWIEQSQEGQL
jgi:D-glycero-alpha-D-manno-heptose 1-phosphate guanylyltransferase